jgi:hypothetical protein
VAGIKPVGPVTGLRGMQFVDDNPEAGPEVVTGNPWPSASVASGYVAEPLRYPGRLYSQGYGEDPIIPSPEEQLIDQPSGVPNAAAVGPDTPYFDATPNTHAGPRVQPYDTTDPNQAAARTWESASAHADGLDNRKPGLNIAAGQDDWQEYFNSPADGVQLDSARDRDKTSAGWGSTDVSAFPANVNAATDFGQHNHRRVATGKNVLMNFLWMPGGQRPLVNTVHGLQDLPVGQGSAFDGQDPSYGYGTAGAVLTRPAGDYEPPADPYQPGPLSAQGLREGPL